MNDHYHDIAIVLDVSTTNRDLDWWQTKQYVMDKVRGMGVPNTTEVAIVTFSEEAETVFELGGEQFLKFFPVLVCKINLVCGLLSLVNHHYLLLPLMTIICKYLA